MSDEHVKGIKALQEENSAYIARIATLEESIRQDKKAQNLFLKRLRNFIDEWEQEENLRETHHLILACIAALN